MIGTLMIAGLCFTLGCILGYAYSPAKTRFYDPLNQAEIGEELATVRSKWNSIRWRGPNNASGGLVWNVRHDLIEPMLDALGISYANDTR